MIDFDTIGYFLYMESKEKPTTIQEELNKLAALVNVGIITQAEFDAKNSCSDCKSMEREQSRSRFICSQEYTFTNTVF